MGPRKVRSSRSNGRYMTRRAQVLASELAHEPPPPSSVETPTSTDAKSPSHSRGLIGNGKSASVLRNRLQENHDLRFCPDGRLSVSYFSVNRYGEPGLQWAGMGVCASLPLRQDRSMFSPAGRIGNGKRPWDSPFSGISPANEILARYRLA
jgi:hypothetical protein